MKKTSLALLKLSLASILASLISITAFAKMVYIEVAPDSHPSTRALTEVAVAENFPKYTVTTDKTQAQLVLTAKTMSLGASIYYVVTKSDGTESFTSKMKADKVDDLDVAATRAVRAAVLGQSVASNAKMNDITDREYKNSNRKLAASRDIVVSIGPSFFTNLDQKSGVYFGLGYLWGLDNKVDIGFNAEGMGVNGNSSNYLAGLILLNYYLLPNNVNSPYLSGGFGYGHAQSYDDKVRLLTNDKDREVNSWALKFGAGYRFYRSHAVNFGVEAMGTLVTKKFKYNDELPLISTIKFNIYF